MIVKKQTTKLIQGTKSATFEEIIDSAKKPVYSKTEINGKLSHKQNTLTRTMTITFDDKTTMTVKVG